MKIFLDTNVILDIYFPERQGKQNALLILQVGNKPLSSRTYVSSLTIANSHYILRKAQGAEQALCCIKELFETCKIAKVDDFAVYHALRSGSPDFEDALQIASAESNACDVIVTHDKKHYSGYTVIPVYTPEEFLAHCRKLV